MSLAAALSRDGGRPASFLPTIKCSSCGEEIEIAEMGEHLCEGPAPTPTTTRGHTSNMSNPFILRRFNTAGQQSSPSHSPLQQHETSASFRVRSPTLSSTQGSTMRSSRQSLAKINPEVANRPFLAPQNGTLDSPLSPAMSPRSGSSNGGKPAFARSMTSPAPRLYDPRPPSPELTANLDCAFPPFPTAATSGRRPSTPSGRITPSSNERSASRSAPRSEQPLGIQQESSTLEPRSPNGNGGGSLLRKLSTLQRGPFASRVPGADRARDASSLLQTASSASSSLNVSDTNEGKSEAPSRPVRPTEEVLSPRFLGQFSAEPSSIVPSPAFSGIEPAHTAERSNTYPRNISEASGMFSEQTLSKMRSEPQLRSMEQRPSISQGSGSEPSAAAIIQNLPPRKDSVNSTRMDHRIHDAPPVPKAIQQYRQEGIHTPTDSGSSISSMANSTPISSNSSTSPVGSLASSVDAFSAMNYDPSRYVEDDNMRVAGLSTRTPVKPGMRAEQAIQRSPSRKAPYKVEAAPVTPLESPMDPALEQIQKRLVLPPSRPAATRTLTAPGPVPRAGGPLPPALAIPQVSGSQNNLSQSASPKEWERSPSSASTHYSEHNVSSVRNTSPNSLYPPSRSKSRRTTNARPPCRGCNKIIEGKSVKAADGRLTGRWHKACFVCRSCKAPFTTADFYVINNEPYCEQHYHEQNGSLCNGCHRGIEGQYLETSSSSRYGSIDKKFHPRCFTCSTCRVVLAQDYFEITGRVFCERHALAAMRAQARLAPGLNPPTDRRGLLAERRTTRLINPMMA